MTVKCVLCDKTEDQLMPDPSGLVTTLIRSPFTGARMCSVCIKAAHEAIMLSERITKEAFEEAKAALENDVQQNAEGQCMCIKCVYRRKLEAQTGVQSATIVAEEVPAGTTRH